MTEIVITGSAARIGGVVRQVGERVSVQEHTALAFVRGGRARLAEPTPPPEPSTSAHTHGGQRHRVRR